MPAVFYYRELIVNLRFFQNVNEGLDRGGWVKRVVLAVDDIKRLVAQILKIEPVAAPALGVA